MSSLSGGFGYSGGYSGSYSNVGTFSNSVHPSKMAPGPELPNVAPRPMLSPCDYNLGSTFSSALPADGNQILARTPDPGGQMRRAVFAPGGTRVRPPLYNQNGTKMIRAYSANELSKMSGSREAAIQARATWAVLQSRMQEKVNPFVRSARPAIAPGRLW